jgi:acetyl esterase/lipase
MENHLELKQRIDPEILSALEMMPPQTLTMENLPSIRSISKKMFEDMILQLPPIKGVMIEDRAIPGPKNEPDVSIRVYSPSDHPTIKPAMLWIHGGGYILGSLDFDDYDMKLIVANLKCTIVSVNYRLAPENPFPAAIEDCYAALKWMWQSSRILNIDKYRIAVGGASAGGGLAAGLAIMARDRGKMKIAYQMLVAPMIDDRNITHSSYAITDPRVWNRDNNLFAWKAYLGKLSEADNVSPYAAASREKKLSGLPRAFIAVGDLDLFVDEDIEYGQRLIQAGVPTELHVYPGVIHGFDKMTDAAITKRFIENRNQAIKKALTM